jgi:hypothetical protein
MSSEFNKRHYKELKREAKYSGTETTYTKVTGYGDTYNGITIAYAPSIKGSSCKMLLVSVSYCAKEDKFKKKHGKYQALLKFNRGEWIQIPLAEFYNSFGKYETNDVLFNMFHV